MAAKRENYCEKSKNFNLKTFCKTLFSLDFLIKKIYTLSEWL